MINLPLTTHSAYQIDSLAFTFIKDAKGITVVRVQADTVEEANELAQTICLYLNQMYMKDDKKEV